MDFFVKDPGQIFHNSSMDVTLCTVLVPLSSANREQQ